MVVYWDDFVFLGMFLFTLGVGWAFGRSFVTGVRNTQDHKSNALMESLFMGTFTEGALICCYVGAVIIIEINPFRFVDDPKNPNSRSFVWIVWLPYATYGILRMIADSKGSQWRTGSRLCLAVAFLCEYAIVVSHLRHLPPGSDRTMYTPQCTLIYLSALFVWGELFSPTSEFLRWLRYGSTVVQGTWLIQVGMTICITGRDWKREEEVGITVLLIFLWHCCMCVLIFKFVKKTVKTALDTKPLESDDEFEEDFSDQSDEEYDGYYEDECASPRKSRIGIKKYTSVEGDPRVSKSEMMTLMLSNWLYPSAEVELMGVSYR